MDTYERGSVYDQQQSKFNKMAVVLGNKDGPPMNPPDMHRVQPAQRHRRSQCSTGTQQKPHPAQERATRSLMCTGAWCGDVVVMGSDGWEAVVRSPFTPLLSRYERISPPCCQAIDAPAVLQAQQGPCAWFRRSVQEDCGYRVLKHTVCSLTPL